jgi:hypothetical protein
MDDFKSAASQTRHDVEIEELYQRAVQDPETLIASFDEVPPEYVQKDFGGYSNSTPLNEWQKKIDSVLKKMNPAQMLVVFNYMQANAGDNAAEGRRCEIAQAVRQEVVDVIEEKYPKKLSFGPRRINDNSGLADRLPKNAHQSANNVAEFLAAEANAQPAPGMAP